MTPQVGGGICDDALTAAYRAAILLTGSARPQRKRWCERSNRSILMPPQAKNFCD
jgi:hypothetical protein